MDPATALQACSNMAVLSMSRAKAETSSFGYLQKTPPSREPHPRVALDHEGISRRSRCQRRELYAREAGGPRSGRRKWRRQIDADEDYCRRRHADLRRDAA